MPRNSKLIRLVLEHSTLPTSNDKSLQFSITDKKLTAIQNAVYGGTLFYEKMYSSIVTSGARLFFYRKEYDLLKLQNPTNDVWFNIDNDTGGTIDLKVYLEYETPRR